MGLRYEPGNWGDLLKAVWVLESIDAFVARLDSTAMVLRLLDPFAGRPEYPLTPACADRLTRVGDHPVVTALEPWLDRGVFPSTGAFLTRLVRERSLDVAWHLFDQDRDARAAWSPELPCRILDLESGYDALKPSIGAGVRAEDHDVILIDPYDLFDQNASVWQDATRVAAHRCVLLYLYNKASRGEGFFRSYKTLRQNLRDCLQHHDGVASILGRVPADGLLPRAHHEVLLLGPKRTIEPLRPRLTEATRELVGLIQQDYAVEDPRQ